MENKDKVISVEGKGFLHIKPDVTRLKINLVSIHDNYASAYHLAEEDTHRIQDIMRENGKDTLLPKTVYFNITKEFRNEYDEYDNVKGEIFLGYNLHHILQIDLGLDAEVLSAIVRQIGKRLKQAEITIGHTVRHRQKFDLLVLERAVIDAKVKAEVMAKAAGYELGTVRNITHDNVCVSIYSESRELGGNSEAALCTAQSLDITPEDMVLEDNVQVEWNLKDIG